MEIVQDIVIVGGGVAGLTTALGLHRLGKPCLVLESSDCLRVTGFAFTTWTNAWLALDALGIGDSLRPSHMVLKSVVVSSNITGLPTSEVSFEGKGKHGEHEVRCLRRKELLLELAKHLPKGTIRFCSKLLSISEENHLKVLHLADGTIIKAKVLIGCDGVNSLVAKWLGLEKPSFTGRWAIRGFANCPGGHNFEPKLQQFFGNGTRAGFRPCDENIMVWFFTFYPSDAHKGIEKEADQGKLKQFVLDHLGKVPEEIRGIVEQTTVSGIICTPVKYRRPFDVLWKDKISKDNVCIAGDALHPMTPDIAQGACAALEDGVILARYLSEVFSSQKIDEELNDEKQYNEIKKCLIKYADERKWRSFTLMATSFTVGMIQQSSGFLADLLRDNGVSYYMSALLLKRGDFDCGRLLPY